MKNITLIKKRNKTKINNLSIYIGVLFVLNVLLLSSFIIALEFNSQSSTTATNSAKTDNNIMKSPNNHIMNKLNNIGTGTIFYQPSLSINHPLPNQNNVVTAPITDVNGIKNSTLFWKYTSIDNTIYNSVMSSSLTTKFSSNINNNYNSTTPINPDGTPTTTSNRTLAVFEYTSSEVVNTFSISIRKASGTSNQFVYITIDRLNVTTDLWEPFVEQGSINGTTGIIGTSSTSFSDTNLSLGYKLTVVAYSSSGGNPSLPYTSAPFQVQQTAYSGTITAPNKPTQVSYYMKAYDNLGNLAQSANYNYLADNIPTVTITSSDLTIFGSSPYNLTVSVSDADGASNINNNSIIAYYWVSDPAVLSQTTLQYFGSGNSNTFLYQASLATTFLVGKSGTLSLYVNATDLVGGVGKSLVKPLTIDNTGPNLQSYTMNTTFTTTIGSKTYYVFNTSEIPELTATITDPSGIKDATLHFRTNGGTYHTIAMTLANTNITLNNDPTSPKNFNATLLSYTSSQIINWYITAHDFGNNLNTSATYTFYVDADAPTLVSSTFSPPYITNITTPILLFNVTDVVGVKTMTAYYSLDNNATWTSATPVNITYNNQLRASSTISFTSGTYQIPDMVSNISKQITFPYTVDQAVLTLSVNFAQGSYLRIWLANDLGKKIVVFDRISGPINKTYSLDLLKLGFNTNDFRNSTFYLITESDSNLYYGNISQFSINLASYNIPYGYQYKVSFPATGNDTTVYYFFNLVDRFNHERNTTIYSYYSDGTAPKVAITNPTQTQENATVYTGVGYKIDYNISDKGGIFLVELYYTVNNKTSINNWIIVDKFVDVTNGSYNFVLNTLPQNGTLYFKIRVYDHAGFSSESPVYKIQFTTTKAPQTTNTNTTTPQTTSTKHTNGNNIISSLLIPLVIVSAVVAVVGGGGYVGYKKLKNNGKLTVIKEKISSKRPKN